MINKSDILLVGRDLQSVETLYDILTESGHRVFMVTSAMEAISRLNEKPFHLVLSEIGLPNDNGLELLRFIIEKWKQTIPVILIADHLDLQTTYNSIKAGARDLFTKPLDQKTVLESVNQILQNKSQPTKKELELRYREKLQHNATENKPAKNFSDIAIIDEITKSLELSSDITSVCWNILNMVEQLLEADRISLVAFKPDKKESQFEFSYSEETGISEKLLPLDQAIQLRVLSTKENLIVPDLEKYQGNFDFLKQAAAIGSVVAIPFLLKGSMVGMMILYKKRINYFSKDALRFLNLLARYSALAIENVSLNAELKSYFNGTIRALIAAVEAKDTCTFGHSTRVARYALTLSNQMYLSKTEIRHLEYLAILHDIGKIGISEDILRKKTPLTPEEKERVKSHSEIGANIVQSLNFLGEGEKIILHHHEWFNGRGYPSGLAGNDIPLFSRIIAIADAFDSMTSDCEHRDPLTPSDALEQLKKSAGEQFDPALVELFTKAHTDKSAA
jgi:putative nucleotidyltransferase with HDIG domain